MKVIYRLLGIPLWTVEEKDVDKKLEAGDNGGDTTSQPMPPGRPAGFLRPDPDLPEEGFTRAPFRTMDEVDEWPS